MDDKVEEYIVNLVEATRNPASVRARDRGSDPSTAPRRAPRSSWPWPRKAHALLEGRGYVTPQRRQVESRWTCCATASSSPTRRKPRRKDIYPQDLETVLVP